MSRVLSLKDNVRIVTRETAKSVLRFTPQIYLREHGKTDGKKIGPVASAVLIFHEKKYFLITAGHVVEDYDPEDLGILIKDKFNFLSGIVRYVNPYLDEKSDKIDIAIWKLDPELVKELKLYYTFLTIDKFGLDHKLILNEPSVMST